MSMLVGMEILTEFNRAHYKTVIARTYFVAVYAGCTGSFMFATRMAVALVLIIYLSLPIHGLA